MGGINLAVCIQAPRTVWEEQERDQALIVPNLEHDSILSTWPQSSNRESIEHECWEWRDAIDPLERGYITQVLTIAVCDVSSRSRPSMASDAETSLARNRQTSPILLEASVTD